MTSTKLFGVIALLFTCVAGVASAGTIKAGSTICISQKYLEKYEKYIATGNEDFADDMRDRAQCVIKPKETRAVLVAEVGGHVQVETLAGFKVWMNRDNFTSEEN